MTNKEDFEQIARKVGLISDTPPTPEEVKDSYLAHMEERCPPAHQFGHTLNETGMRAITRVYRRNSGRTWAGGRDILDRTVDEVYASLYVSFIEAYASGMIIGKDQDPLLHGLQSEKDWYDLSRNEDFRAMALLLATEFETDEELRDHLYEYFKSTCYDIAERAMFLRFDADHPAVVAGAVEMNVVHKVWDIYKITHHAVCSNVFCVGYEFGKEKALREALEGISRASKDVPEEE